MKYLISPDDHDILDDLDVLQAETRTLLKLASLDARAEWKKLESRFPSTREIRDGFIALSSPELHEVRATARRFHAILSKQPGGPLPPVPSCSTVSPSDLAALAGDGGPLSIPVSGG
jgi:hypothetical protein